MLVLIYKNNLDHLLICINVFMCTWLHVYMATCINVYKGTGIWREFLHASPNSPKCQGKRQDYHSV